MNRSEAKKLAETAKPEEIVEMLTEARKQIKNWKAPAHINPALSRGAIFNILSACDPATMHHYAKINAIAEFGEFLPNFTRKNKRIFDKPIPSHQDPVEYPKPKQTEER
jgi:hypothetical protein